ncbi:hypothetical protein [uncultured Propionibacterium sp.]|uniref:hypothetical protein n=1 Tax=uncultured Propionibacterium sp. TaxID=218066 RepID=UPI00292F0125|nr:hypothetical protein [uncultured Propionibacterium sp.]
MGISDELRDLAATPPEATVLSASLADQAVGFAVRARRVARMKIAAAAAAGAIATAGVGIGLLNSTSDPALPTTTPVVTITPSPSSASQTSASPSYPSPSPSPSSGQGAAEQPAATSDATSEPTSQAPVLVQPDTPEQTPAPPEPDKNIIEKIIDTVASIPQRVVEFFQPDRSPGDGPSPSASPASPSQSPTPSSPSASPTSSTTGSSSASASQSMPSSSKSGSGTVPSPTDPGIKCWIEYQGGSSSPKQVPCEKYLPTPDADSSEQDSSSARSGPTSPACTLVVSREGQDDIRRRLDQCPSDEESTAK